MSEKEKILSKFNVKDYINNLEQILEEKNFDEEAKSLILSIFYKIDNFYKDYILVKKESESKNKFLEEYINIIKNKCNKIQILSPHECTKTKKYFLDKINGEIKTFPNEIILLYALFELTETNIEAKQLDFTDKCVATIINKGNTINSAEPIRDFNGWSWNIEINDTKNMEYNLIFQNLSILFGYEFINNLRNENKITNILKNKSKDEQWENKKYEFIECLEAICISLYNNISTTNHEECLQYKNSVIEKNNVLNNGREYIEEITKQNSLMIKKIQNIDIILNDINLIKKEFNKSLEQEKQYFCISDFVDKMELERKKLLKSIDNNNKSLSPKEFLKYQDEYKMILDLYEIIKEEQEKINVQSSIIKFQKIFLECMKLKIQSINNKKHLYNIATELRYYSNIPYNKYKGITKHEKVLEVFEETSKELIYKMLENKVIDTGFKNENLNYEIVKYIFKTKVIKLDNIILKIKHISNNHIEVQYYDGNMLDYKQNFEIPFDEEITNKKDKKIKLFKVGG